MTLILHTHPLSSYCWKVQIALYENGAPFEARMVNLGDPDARAAFAALWPTGKIPLLEDDGRIVPETSIQIEHLDRRYPGHVRLLPEDPEARLEARLWDRLFDQYVMTPMQRIVSEEMRPKAERDAAASEAALATLDLSYDMIDNRLSGRTWAAGDDFSLADCAAAPALFYATTIRPIPAGHTTLAAYFERLMARPSVARAIVEAQPFFQYYPLRRLLPARFLGGGADAS